jgi:hypothetical protein
MIPITTYSIEILNEVRPVPIMKHSGKYPREIVVFPRAPAIMNPAK